MRLAFLILAVASYPAFSQLQQQRLQQQQQQQQPTGKSAISGNVVNEVTKEPVKKARVSLNGTVSLNAVTDDAGHFAFKALPAGTYLFQVQNENLSRQRPRLDSLLRSKINLADDEQKSGVVLTWTPPASISGRLTDEEGLPMANCMVVAMQFDLNQGNRTLGMRNSGNSDAKGEYRIPNLAAGKYFILARCPQNIPLPHAFIRRNSGVEVPTLSYAPQYYPGTQDFQAATKVQAAGGADQSGIDFRMAAGGGVPVRGKAVGPSAAVQVMLEPRDPMQRSTGTTGARMNRQTGEFRFEHVMPGSYNLIAFSAADNQRYSGIVPMEIGSSAPDPVAVTLNPAMTLSGTVAQEGDSNSPMDSARISLTPLEHFFGGPPPNAPVRKDGAFTLNNVSAGRFALRVDGIGGYIKSIALNERELPSTTLDIPEGGAGTMKVVLASAWAQVEGTVSGLPSEPGQNFAVLSRIQDQTAYTNPAQPMAIDPQGKFTASNVQPGKYLICAVGVDPWTLMQSRETLEAMKGRCETVDLSPSGRSTVQVRFIPSKDLETILAGLDN